MRSEISVLCEKEKNVSKVKWLKGFEPLNRENLIRAAKESVDWIERFGHKFDDTERWDVRPGTEVEKNELLQSDAGIYAGAAGIALLYIRLYVISHNGEYLERAKAGVNYVIGQYKGKGSFVSDSEYLQGVSVGYLNGPAGGGFVAKELYKVTGENKYRDFALKVADDSILAAKEENGSLSWYGFYGLLGEGGLILYLVDIYAEFGGEKYLDAASKAANFIEGKKEEAPGGGYRWYVMPTETFPTIGKAGGYFPGFEYGAAGCGYILASVYEHTHEEKFLVAARNAAKYILNIANYSEDKTAALVRYNDTYLTDLYYLGVCQGPIGTSRLFFKLYELTGESVYKDFVLQLTDGLLAAGAPTRHSPGYWRTNCYCCGAPGMLEHFIHIHKLTGEAKYLDAAYETAEVVIGESTVKDGLRNWYTAWNRHEPFKSEAYIGLYHGTGGCASALLEFAKYLEDGGSLPPYLEDPYKILYKKEK